MIEEKVYDRIRNNKNILDKDKDLIFNLFDKSNKITFGKISARQEGYIYEAIGYPRCTAVLQMDGTKAAALMEWAKKEIIENAKERIAEVLSRDKIITQTTLELILDEALLQPERERDSAASVGTETHDNIEKDLNGEEAVENESLRLFRKVWGMERVELICTEMPIICKCTKGAETMGFGGKLDILAYKNGEFIIYDNKTSRSVHNSYGLQVAAYKNAVEQMSDYKIKVNTAKIIHIPNLSDMKEWQKKQYKKLGNLIECKNLDEAFNHFNLLLQQYYKRNNKYF